MGRARAARGAPIISSFTRAEGWLGSREPPRARECGAAGAGSGGPGQMWGAARGFTTLGSTRGQAGSQRCERRCGTHFLRSD